MYRREITEVALFPPVYIKDRSSTFDSIFRLLEVSAIARGGLVIPRVEHLAGAKW
jgi:hypothetical protein